MGVVVMEGREYARRKKEGGGQRCLVDPSATHRSRESARRGGRPTAETEPGRGRGREEGGQPRGAAMGTNGPRIEKTVRAACAQVRSLLSLLGSLLGSLRGVSCVSRRVLQMRDSEVPTFAPRRILVSDGGVQDDDNNGG